MKKTANFLRFRFTFIFQGLKGFTPQFIGEMSPILAAKSSPRRTPYVRNSVKNN
jgi:hypothetical protein